MAEEYPDLDAYKDLSELEKELRVMKGKKEVSIRDLHDAMQRLSQTVAGMLDVFAAAAEQMKLEEKGYETDAKKHEIIIAKLDKIIDQNKVIAQAMTGIADMMKEKGAMHEEPRESLFKPEESQPTSSTTQPIQTSFFEMAKQEMPKEPLMQSPRQIVQPTAPAFAPSSEPSTLPALNIGMPDFGAPLPPMQPSPAPDLDFEMPFSSPEDTKKKKLFGIFRK